MWRGVVTNVGNALLAQWGGGGTLTIVGACAGTGTVPVEQLMSCTDVSGVSHTLSILETNPIERGVKYLVQFSAAVSAYVAMQVGVWAKLNDGNATLLAIYQGDSDSGISVPSIDELVDFAFTFGANVVMDNTGDYTTEIDTSVFVTNGRFLKERDNQMLLVPEVPDCVVTPSFDTDGNLTQITHASIVNGETVRIDAFTKSSTSIEEVRTLASGKTLTITTNMTTKATTLAFGTAT